LVSLYAGFGLDRCTFSDNSAGSGGGGIANFGTLTVTDSTFSGNSAFFGGAIAAYTGQIEETG
jgi:predicted outer membrane repeat protein